MDDFTGRAYFEGDQFVVSDPDLAARLDRNTLSPSGAQAIASCPARWAGEKILPRSADPFGAAEIGTAVHAVLETLYGLEPAERTKDAALSIVQSLHEPPLMDGVVPPDDRFDLPRWQALVWQKTAPVFDLEDPRDVEVVGLEREVRSRVGDVPFMGRVDMTLRDGDGRLMVRDWKSGKSKSDGHRRRYGDPHGDQTILYDLAMRYIDDVPPDGVEIVYTSEGVRHEPSVSAKDRDRVQDQFVASWKTLRAAVETGRYPLADSPLCGWCPLMSVCPAAAQGSRRSRSDVTDAGALMGVRAVPDGSAAIRRTEPAEAVDDGTDDQEKDMSNQDNQLLFGEDKAWFPTVGDLANGNGFGTTAAFGLTSMAVEQLHGAEQAITGTSVRALANTFAHIVAQVQNDLGGSMNLADGLNTRLRGALHTTLRTYPLPFGGGEAEWDEWVSTATRRVRSIAVTAHGLWSTGPVQRPWEALAVDRKAA